MIIIYICKNSQILINYTKGNLNKLEQLYGDIGFKIRYEKGHFNSGYCIVEHQKMVIINKFYDTEGRINVLLDILSTLLVVENLLSEASLKFFKQILREQESAVQDLTT